MAGKKGPKKGRNTDGRRHGSRNGSKRSSSQKGRHAAAVRAQKLDQILALAGILATRRGGGRGWRLRDVQERLREAGYPNSRSTIYRDINKLRTFGFQVEQEKINGETRYRIPFDSLKNWAAMPVGLQREALALALMTLRQFGRTELYDHLARFAERWRILEASSMDGAWREPLPTANLPRVLVVQWAEAGAPQQVMNQVERALRLKRRMRIRYRGTRDSESTWRTVDPAGLQISQRALYLHAWCLRRNAPRTFKLSRIVECALLEESAEHAERIHLARRVEHAAVAWDGDPVEVAVRMSATVAPFVREYPLHKKQRVVTQRDGSVVVHATVAGLVEATRWVIGWGKEARALSPPALVEAVREELHAAMRLYEPDGGEESSAPEAGKQTPTPPSPQ